VARQKAAGAILVDWLTPDTWKPAVELVKEWQALGAFFVLVVGAVGGWATGLFRWAASKLRRAKPAAPSAAPEPKRPLRFVGDDRSTFHTPIGSDENTGTHLIGVWDVTNVSDRAFVLLKVRLGSYISTSDIVGVENDRDPAFRIKGTLKARRMSRVKIELTFAPAIHVPSEDLILDVIFTDNYEDEHRVPGVRFPRFT